jgi:hypothetical protein
MELQLGLDFWMLANLSKLQHGLLEIKRSRWLRLLCEPYGQRHAGE